ncbi:MAG TPA: 3-dehydroquinate synthase [Polyangiaceae bacterium]|nr:3-dehydroquinate synthase [Polyangiaceae bacterium]
MQRPLLVSGFMGTGKSTVSRLVAEWCGRPLVDLDAEIEREAGVPIAELFATRGEPAFRLLEREALDRVLGRTDAPVVALGGGALLQRGTRLDAIDRGVVVTLDASVEEILKRTAGSDRPLLQAGDPRVRVEQLLAERKLAYAECHGRVSTTGRSPEDVARDVVALWRRDPIGVASGEASYAVDVGAGIAVERLPGLLRGASLGLLVTDRNVQSHHGDSVENGMEQSGVRTATVVLDPGEEHKNTASLERIWSAALAAQADRKSRFVALGGGVVSDVAGFAAATWMRGVSWICVPTTLLSMVDASVGGKTAIDLKTAKNAVGAFWQPSAVLCDTAHLGTEPARGYASALAEVVKTAIIGDPDLLSFVEQHPKEVRAKDAAVVAEVVRRSIRVKARVVSLDEREDGLRATLNLGHTVGHALEAYGGYGKLRHGEAVSLGLVAALRVGERLGLTEKAVSDRCILALRVLGLPVELSSQPLARAVDLIGHDKKRAGKNVRFVVARSVGQVDLVDLPLDELRGHVVSLAS